MTAPLAAKTRKTLIGALETNARIIKDATITRDSLIARAVERGITQTDVAKAADLSQAHVSRIVAANRKANAARKTTRRSKRNAAGRTV